MTQKEQLMYLISEYHKGNYRTTIFCDEFTRILCLEKDDSLSNKEKEIFLKSNEVFCRYSPYEEDIKSGFLFGEDKVRKEFDTLLKKMEIEFNVNFKDAIR